VAEAVFDSSAVLALLLSESNDSELSAEALGDAVVSAVNLIEIRTKLIDLAEFDEGTVQEALSLIGRVEHLTEEQAIVAADLRKSTKQFGLSLGDRACLALALQLGLDVYTADRVWSKVDVGCVVHMIR